MRRLLLTAALMAGMCAAAAFANYTATQGTGTNFLSFDTGGVKSAAATLANSAGTEIGTSANPVEINLRSSTVGIATSANQTTGNSSLSTIATNTTGIATASAQTTAQTSLTAIAASAATTATNTGLGALVDESAFTEGSTSNIMFGGYFKSAPTALTTGQSGAITLTTDRKLITLPYADASNFAVSGVITSAMTGTTSTSLIAAPGGTLHNYITQCTFSNSHATQGTIIVLQDGSGGTTFYSAPLAPAYGGATLTFPTPLRQPTANTALFVANVTTGSSTFAACSGYKGA